VQGKPKLALQFFYLCDGQGEVPCTECSIQEPNSSSDI
jgi:hypothetical protein